MAQCVVLTGCGIPYLDDTDWRVFVNSHYHATNDTWELLTKPYINVVP
jgi:hypothetical protein